MTRRVVVVGLVSALLLGAAALLLTGWWGRASAPPSEVSAQPGACSPSASPDPRQRAVCRGVWVRPARRDFVPQGIALGPGRQAIISGYRAGRPGHRFCQLLVVDRRTGDVAQRIRRIESEVLGGEPILCRHGGGLARSAEGVWVAETGRLWLLDSAALARGEAAVLRWWRVNPPVRGSALVRRGRSLGITGWSARGPRRTDWVRLDELLAPGVAGVTRFPATGTVAVYRSVWAPRRAQGAAAGPGGTWYAASTTYCGILHRPDGARLAFIPGAEGIAFEKGRLWVVSESGARAYRKQGDRPVVPTLVSLDPETLDPDTPTGCSW